MSKCDCAICKMLELRAKALESNDIDYVKEQLIEFADLWLYADFDKSVLEAVMDGSWPTAREQLTKALGKCK